MDTWILSFWNIADGRRVMVDGECGEPSGRFSHRHPVDRNMSTFLIQSRSRIPITATKPSLEETAEDSLSLRIWSAPRVDKQNTEASGSLALDKKLIKNGLVPHPVETNRPSATLLGFLDR
ncbi:hypothetical protein I7I51_08893 [Histoplasma capsulatum]|uniref:Uncharacterized protein n=1 Tax=Ajellomyces capsulatus TaxID=5037 RepID=A0A8A1LZ40_AJECA|nr:hypothetical protein I7I51_08893 [Histoplasma capsulatum]